MLEDGHESADIVRMKRVGRDQDLVEQTVAHVPNCVFTPASSVENEDGRQQNAATASLYAPPGAAVPQPTDRVRIRGELWACDGRADVWNDLDGNPQGYEQRLTKVVG